MRKIEYPVYLVELAQDIAKIRSALSKDVYSEGTDKHRGGREHTVSTYGVLGELIAHHVIHAKFERGEIYAYKFAPLVDFSPVFEPDYWYQMSKDSPTLSVDVKCTNRDFWSINKSSHDNKECDYYMMIKTALDGKALVEFILHSDVNLWEVKSSYTEYYYRVVHQGQYV
jgi:hypothetical protein